MTKKATEDQLGQLHGKVAEVMTAALAQSETAAYLLSIPREENEKIPLDVILFLEKCKEVNPSLLTAATKFLKDNNISADPTTSTELSELEKTLASRQPSAKVSDVPIH